jgi:hypothetical protein
VETEDLEAQAQGPTILSTAEGLSLAQNVAMIVQTELSKANFLRMRQQFREAEELCLVVLRTYPQNVEAHVLLGDIFADQGQFEHANQWYSLALDLQPEDFAVRQKMQIARGQVRHLEALSSLDQLGLPRRQGSRPLLFGIGALALIAVCAVLAYNAGQQSVHSAPPTPASVLNQPIVAPESPEVAVPPAATPPTAATGNPIIAALTNGMAPDRLVEAMLDPRDQRLTLTVRAADGEDSRALAAETARYAMSQIPEVQGVTVRVVRAGTVAYIADLSRRDAVEAQSADLPEGVPWYESALRNEWAQGEMRPAP